ncbi:hypothetical protein TIFTF001_045565 [Ficus carica]|uniref:Transposase (putative) gypsy type domain-containing protein n=1 Tax=Ficus carica TaxID=3494 RepID=A0AA87YSG5_FICCA|nr:hypothetical protein TIFTF001_045565 [Ficus carica]
MYTIYFECGLRLPIPPLLIQSMNHYQLAIPQLMPNRMRVFLGLIVLADEAGVELTVVDILAICYPQENSKDHGRYSMYPRRKKQVLGEMKNADRYWQDRYFFMHVNENKESNKPPPKALLFEEKLERLLALPNREWDEINVPKRFRASSLWKDFIEISLGIVKRVPSWVDWPFVIRVVLKKLFGTLLFIEPLTDEEALIADLALDMMSIEFPNPKDLLAKKKAQKEAEMAVAAAAAASSARGNEPPPLPVIESSPNPPVQPMQSPAKKRKADGKPKRKIPKKRKKSSKAASPETNVEQGKSKQDVQRIGVNLPPGTSLLQDRKLSVEIMRQLLSDVDLETINSGRVPNHVDDLNLIKELEDENKRLEELDKKRGEKLLVIEENFKDVKASADGLIGELKTVTQSSKEMTDMMKVMVERFDEAQVRIKSLEADNSALVAKIVDAYEKATFKARYDLLKEYKQGLLVEADVDDEIELHEDEAGCSLSAPADVIVPASNEQGPSGVEPPINADPSEDRETRQ